MKKVNLICNRLVFSVLFLFLLSPHLISAQTITKWSGLSHLDIAKDGKIDDSARFYISEDRAFVLILSSIFDDALILNIKDKIVAALRRAEIRFEEDKFTALTAEKLQVRYLGGFEQDGSTLGINLEGMDVNVIPRPHLVGETTMDKILNHSPAYKHLMGMYQPTTGAFQFLSHYKKPTNIVIVFGTWCEHCKKSVPTIMKTISECNNSNLHYSFVGISKDFDQPAEFLKQNKVKSLPSVIVFQGGKEIGRITGNPKESMEDALVQILEGS